MSCQALLLAVALAVIDVIRRSANPHDAVLGWVERLGRHADVRMHPSAKVTPGVLVYRLDDRLFFANVNLRPGPASGKPSRAHPNPRTGSCSTPKASATSTPPEPTP